MIRYGVRVAVTVLLLLVSVVAVPAAAAAAEDAVITVLHPSTGTIQALMALRAQGLIPSEGISVIGVYHEKQVTDFAPSRELIASEGLGWITLHPISAPLDEGALWGRNPCSAELEAIAAGSDGILFFGGADIPPAVYGEKTRMLTGIETPYRHHLEASLVFHLLGGFQDEAFPGLLEEDPELLVVGICLGAQTLNVGTGGTLVQDIPSEVYGLDSYEDVLTLPREAWHRNPYYWLRPGEELARFFMHRIKLLQGTKMATEMGIDLAAMPLVYSSHHQAMEKLGKGIKVTATSIDGKVVEVIEHQRFPNVLGVQFHPEARRLWVSDHEASFVPGEAAVGLHAMVTGDEATIDFHTRLWAWIIDRVLAHRQARSASAAPAS